MRFGVLFAVQLALVASEPTVLLQSHGDWQVEDEDEAGQLERGLANFAKAVMSMENRGPAFLNLLKTVTKKNENGEEYLELKPLVSMVTNVGRLAVKSGEMLVLPQINAAMLTTAHQFEAISLEFEKLISDVFLAKGEATEIMDWSLAIRFRESAQALQQIVGNAIPLANTVVDGAGALVSFAKLAVGNMDDGEMGNVLDAMQGGLKIVKSLAPVASAFTKNQVDMLSRSTIKDGPFGLATIKDGADYTEDKALKMKAHAIKHIVKQIEKFELYCGRSQQVISQDWMKVVDAFGQLLPPTPMVENFKAFFKNLIVAVDGSFKALFLGASGQFKLALQQHSATMK